jgi:hypothetical protein
LLTLQVWLTQLAHQATLSTRAHSASSAQAAANQH